MKMPHYHGINRQSGDVVLNCAGHRYSRCELKIGSYLMSHLLTNSEISVLIHDLQESITWVRSGDISLPCRFIHPQRHIIQHFESCKCTRRPPHHILSGAARTLSQRIEITLNGLSWLLYLTCAVSCWATYDTIGCC